MTLSSAPGESFEENDNNADIAAIVRSSLDALGAVGGDPKKELNVGFIATLAVAALARVSVDSAKRGGASQLLLLESAALEGAREKCLRTADSRFKSRRNFAGAVWQLIGNALLIQQLEQVHRDGLNDGSVLGSVAFDGAATILREIDRRIDLYSNASPEQLAAAGIAGGVRIVEGIGRSGPSRVVGAVQVREISFVRARQDRMRQAFAGLLLIAVLSGLALAGQIAWTNLSGANTRNGAINPAVFVAFSSVERQCLAEAWPNASVRCQGALTELRDCAGSGSECTAENAYCVLDKLGFDLPNFYRADTPYARETPC